MAEHTKTLVAGHIVTFFNGRERTPTDEAVIHFEGDEDSEIEIHCPDAPIMAAKIVKAVNNHDALVKRLEPFAKLAALFDNYESDIRKPESESVLINVRLADLRDARTLLAVVGGRQDG